MNEDKFKKFLPELRLLAKAGSKERGKLLEKADPELLKLLCEVVLNVLKGTLRLPQPHYKKLRPHKRTLLLLSRPFKSLRGKQKAIFKKKGGFLPIILPALLSALAGFAGESISKAING